MHTSIAPFRRTVRRCISLVAALLFGAIVAPLIASGETYLAVKPPPCPHPSPDAYGDGSWTPTSAQLRPQRSPNRPGPQPPLILCNADLRGLDLRGSNLAAADLNGADVSHHAILSNMRLSSANFVGARLIDADLRGATMYATDLTNANLVGADLSDTKLNNARFIGAKMLSAKLHDSILIGAAFDSADLGNADLSGAFLTDASVSEARLDFANLSDTVYAPTSGPPDAYVAGIRGLSTVHVPSGDEVGLVQLRALLVNAGLRDAEREATYAIERSITTAEFASAPQPVKQLLGRFGFIDAKQEQIDAYRSSVLPGAHLSSGDQVKSSGWESGALRLIGFDLTTAYGLHPDRALGLILILVVLFSFAYVIPIFGKGGDAGAIYKVFPADRLPDPANDASSSPPVSRVRATTLLNGIGLALYFSIISAVNIGFESFTPGDWIRRLQSEDYTLEAVGWVRIVAGAQALVSLFLLAIWALTQFGRPFE